MSELKKLIDQTHNKTKDESRWNDTLEALGSVKSGKLVGADEVHDWLDSWGTKNEKIII